MEDNMRKTVIIDFFGPPGSGKSTVVRILAGKLRNQNYKIQDNISKINNDFTSIKRIAIKSINTVTFTSKNLFFLLRIFSMLDKYSYLNLREMIKQWINICFVLTQINRSEQSDIILADQGLIQAAISLSVRCNDVDVKKIIEKLIEKVDYPIHYVCMSIQLKTNLERLSQRTNGRSRVDFEKKEEEKIEYLNTFYKHCYDAASIIGCKIFNNDASYDIMNNSVSIELLMEIIALYESNSSRI